MKRIFFILAGLIMFVSMTTAAEARRSHHHYKHVHHVRVHKVVHSHSQRHSVQVAHSDWFQTNPMFQGIVFPTQVQPNPQYRHRRVHVANVEHHIAGLRRAYGDTVMLSHPAGCPRSNFCACGAAIEVGLNPRSHMAAMSFSRYPQSSPGYNMVGYIAHHALVLKQQIQGNIWMAADYNSGGHMSRLHPVDISRYRIVNPHG